MPDALAGARRVLGDVGWKEGRVPKDPWNDGRTIAFAHDGVSPLDPYGRRLPPRLFPRRSRMLRLYPARDGRSTRIVFVVSTSYLAVR